MKNIQMVQKVFFHLLDVTILNESNIYMVRTGKRTSLRQSGQAMVLQMLDKYGTVTVSPGQHRGSGSYTPDRFETKDVI